MSELNILSNKDTRRPNRRHRTVSVYDLNRGRQARHMLETNISESIRPWFQEEDPHHIGWAIKGLNNPQERGRAADFLGLLVQQD